MLINFKISSNQEPKRAERIQASVHFEQSEGASNFHIAQASERNQLSFISKASETCRERERESEQLKRNLG